MKLVSAVLRRAVYPLMSRAGMFSRRVRDGEVCVITYHGVLPAGWTAGASPIESTLISAEQFREQLRLLKARYNLISPEAFHAWLKEGTALPSRAVLLTCDDGLLNVLTDMAPVLLEEEVRCLLFVTAASLGDSRQCLWYEELYRMLEDAPDEARVVVGGRSARKAARAAENRVADWWSLVEELSALRGDDRRRALQSLRAEWGLPSGWGIFADESAERRYQLLTREEIRRLAEQGMTIGAHTSSHPLLAKMSAALAEQEIRECKADLEAFLGREVWALAYPFGQEGSAGAREGALAEAAGYACAFLNCGGGLLRRDSPRFRLPRAHVTADMALPEFEAQLSGFHQALQRRFRGGGSPS